ncbi:MAG: 2-oxoglutarate dehydrogenase E1 component [Phycisphaerae bacterium]|jgi:2-oxoglutarate dehydrogenase E1 component
MSAQADLPNSTNLAFVEQLYAEYVRDPAAVEPRWRAYFDSLGDGVDGRPPRLGPSFQPSSLFNPPGGRADAAVVVPLGPKVLQDRVDQLVRAYRVRGHKAALLDPLARPRPHRPELEPGFYGFSEADLGRPFSSRTISGAGVRTLGEILALLQATYCGAIGVQFMHIDDYVSRHWLQERMEATQNRLSLTREEQLRILTRLTDAVMFEEFIQKKYIGAKRFSLEGGESLIPLLDLAIGRACEQGIEEIVLGMAHRGRLNVLANILGKSPRLIFREFEDRDPRLHTGKGDVKYHLGYHGDWTTPCGRKMHLALAFNPSHLEFVNPVVLGRCRAKQDRLGDPQRCMSLLIHGDAAFAGEGVVQETLNLSELGAYRVGGTLHVVVNNQIGFTTDPSQGRSSTYATDVAKMLQSPIVHVNGEDPVAVATAVRLAMDFRQEFHRDVVVDMYCYRRHGHNEGDEPAFTQPALYRAIEQRKSVRDGYLDNLLKLGEVSQQEADEIAAHRRALLEEELSGAKRSSPEPTARPSMLGEVWSAFRGGSDAEVPDVDTAVPAERLVELIGRMTRVPDGFRLLTKAQRLLGLRQSMARGEHPVDWAVAELLVLSSLATEGTRVRLTGQDSERGTFSHRHAVWHDFETGEARYPLQHIESGQAPVEIHNSPLSEVAVLGFEHGYSIGYPDALVMWEAQFGDFNNVAQVIIDQFIVSAEDKWHSLSGLVLLLPHGFEGQGPEHSSARPERFLMMAADDNIQVAMPSTPAQYFHLLRRQVRRPWRKPLIVMTPKSLLRHARCVSSLAELATGRFQRILPDDLARKDPPKRVLLCSGKIYYELHQERADRGRDDVAIVRVEQLYPLASEALAAALADCPDGTEVWWVQEEPENMGAWRHIYYTYAETALKRFALGRVCRPASASPATGSSARHKQEQQELLARALS